VLVGLVIAALTLFILAAVLASRSARAHARTLWLTVTLVLLSVVVQPVLGDAGTHVPAFGALHGLNGLAIFAVAGWLTWETARRRAASPRPRTRRES
jgi:membrane associated rhomboid family serine protease